MNSKKIIVIISVFCLLFSIYCPVFAATNISSNSSEHWAWNDVIGWIDFYSTANVYINSAQFTGYANSSVGYIALDCATSPNGNICGTSNFKVSNNAGDLSGYAWNDAIGWISFSCDNTSSCGASNYKVTINPDGAFIGWAWNDIVGWISFSCDNTSSCGASDYKVKTSWATTAATGTLLSSIFDTGVVGGVGFNSILWQGNQPTGTTVKFQFASATSTSNFPTPIGPGGTSALTDVYVSSGPNNPVALTRAYHNNHRYYRYKIILESDVSRTISPRVDDVIINWSP